MEKPNPISYKLRGFATPQFSYTHPSGHFNLNEPDFVSFYANPQIGYQVENKTIVVDFSIDISLKNTEEKVAHIQTLFHYQVDNLNECIEVNGNVIKDTHPDFGKFLITITGASYSTMRGIISEKFRGTILDRALLPIIDPSQFFKPPDPPQKGFAVE
jgi:hypothetical protein